MTKRYTFRRPYDYSLPHGRRTERWVGTPEPSGVVARRFDGVDDRLTLSIGDCNQTGAMTFAALVRHQEPGLTIFENENSSLTGQCSLGVGTNVAMSVALSNSGTAAGTNSSQQDGWIIAAATRPAGASQTVRVHLYKNGSWVHVNGATTLNDPFTQADGFISFSTVFNGTIMYEGLFAVAAQWRSVLSDGQIETLSTNWRTQDWADLSPNGLWDFNQADVATDVIDLTGNGANQTSRTGTTVVYDGPAGWDYGVSQFVSLTPATETDAAQALVKVKQVTLTPATESDVAIAPGTNTYARYFDDSDDYITASIGNSSLTGAWTLAAYIRVHDGAGAELNPIISFRRVSDGIPALALEINGSGQPQLRANNVIRWIDDETEAGALRPGVWGIIVATKPAGTSEARFHIYQGGTWNHQGTILDLTSADTTAQDEIYFGRLGTSGTYADIDLGVVGAWAADLTDLQVEELASPRKTSTWKNNSGAAPVGLWNFNQDNVGTAVLDQTGGGADQSSITGTSVVQNGPANWNFTRYFSITPATETDAAQALSFTKTIFKSLTPATETDAAQVLDIDKHVTLTPATEADAAQTLSFTQADGSITITPATETDAAQALNVDKYATLAPTTETDTAQALDKDKRATIVSATETDTAQALSITHIHYRTITAATETDAAQALDKDKQDSLTPATESDVAQALSVTKTIFKALTPATETDAAQALDKDKLKSLTPVTETDTAQTLKVTHLGAATETDTAQALDKDKRVTLVAATETDTAQALSVTHIHYRTITPATETDAAQTLNIDKSKVLVAATETDAAQTLSITHIHYRTVTPATESDAAQTLTYSQAGAYTIGAATETDAAQALSFTKTIFKSLTVTTETDAAQALNVDKSVTRVPATETDAAQVLNIDKTKGLTSATETDTAQALSFTKTIFKTLTAATETDAAQALSFTKTIFKSLTPATETDSAQALDRDKYKNLVAATEADAAQALSVTKTIFKTLTPATETDAAQALDIDKYVALVPATETDFAAQLDIEGSQEPITLVPATSTETCVALSYHKRATVAAAVEANVALALTKLKHKVTATICQSHYNKLYKLHGDDPFPVATPQNAQVLESGLRMGFAAERVTEFIPQAVGPRAAIQSTRVVATQTEPPSVFDATDEEIRLTQHQTTEIEIIGHDDLLLEQQIQPIKA